MGGGGKCRRPWLGPGWEARQWDLEPEGVARGWGGYDTVGEPAGSVWVRAQLLATLTQQLQEEPPTEFVPRNRSQVVMSAF